MIAARQGIAGLSLAGVFIALYLYLFKIGKIGALACGTGGCERVQLSPQARFLGVEVALIGLIGYAVLLVTALVALQPQHASSASWPAKLLLLLSGGAMLFTGYLTALELFVIHAICRWCVVSAVLILAIFTLALLDRRRGSPPAQ